jgi:hypothetical protein
MTIMTTSATGSSVFAALAKREILAYLKHPLFLVGAALTTAIVADGPDANSSSIFHVIVPAAGLGLFGLLVMVSLVRRSDRAHEAAGAVVVTERTRTLALATAVVVPFACGLAFFVWAAWAYHDQPPLPHTIPFGGVDDGWVYAVLFALGAISAAGGPILGLVVGRWLHFRGGAAVSVVLLVMVTIVMQGLIVPLRFIRVVTPWTYFGGPYGVEDDPDRWIIMTGSPQWYCAYLIALCVAGVIVAMLHDREQPRQRLVRALVGVGVVAAVCCLLAMTQGVQETMVNPISSATGWN